MDLYYYVVDHGYVKRTIVAVLMGVCGLEIIVSLQCLLQSQILFKMIPSVNRPVTALKLQKLLSFLLFCMNLLRQIKQMNLFC